MMWVGCSASWRSCLTSVLTAPERTEWAGHQRGAGALEKHRSSDSLGATDYSLLDWLYLIEFSAGTNPELELVRSAQEAARDGLAREAYNEYCANLLRPTEEELREP